MKSAYDIEKISVQNRDGDKVDQRKIATAVARVTPDWVKRIQYKPAAGARAALTTYT